MMTAPTLIYGGQIWTGDGGQPVAAGLLVADGRVAGIVPPEETTAARGRAEEAFDATGMLITPPLFDGHVHSTATLFRGTENSFPLELWSYYAINYGRGFTERCLRAAVRLTAVEMIRNGIGGYVDHFPQARFAAAALGAHQATGLRIGFAPFFADLMDEDILGIPLDPEAMRRLAPLGPRDPATIGEMFVDLHHRIGDQGTGRVALLLGPNAPQRCSDALWTLWRDLRSRLDIGSHTHLLETLPQAHHARARWAGGLVAALEQAGLLDGRSSIAHAVWLGDDELECLARHGVTVSHNPISNLMLGSGRFDVRAALDAGVTLALGTDSSNTGGRHDLFEVMRHMLTAGRAPGSDYGRWIKPIEAMRAATMGGARAIEPSCGRIAVGMPADLLAVDFRGGSLAAAPVSIDSLVVHGDASAVKALMIGGAWLLRHGRIEAFDEAEALDEAAACAAELRAAAGEAARDLIRLHPAYRRWQDAAFGGHSCPACGGPAWNGIATKRTAS